MHTTGTLPYYEIWQYDDAALSVVPPYKHLGYAGILSDEGTLDYERLIRHFQSTAGR